MRTKSVLIIILCLSLSITCAVNGAGNRWRPGKPSSSFTLSIKSGYQQSESGQYQAGTKVHIMAAYPGDGSVFKGWKGSGKRYLENPRAQRTTLTMPRKNIELRATYAEAEPWEAEYLEIQTTYGTAETPGISPVYYHVPSRCKGIIIFCHGTGGRAKSTQLKLEYKIFLRMASKIGYGYFSTSSHERGPDARWENTVPGLPLAETTPNPNKDVQNIKDIIAHMQNERIIPRNTNFFSMGISQGSSFASIISFFFKHKAASFNIASGLTGYVQHAQYETPSIICLAANDSIVGETGGQKTDQNILALQAKNIPCEKHVSEAQPVYPLRFMVIKETDPSFTEADSRAIHEALKANGIIDANNMIVATGDQVKSFLSNTLPEQYKDKWKDIKATLTICMADHEFNSDNAVQILSFFKQNTPNRLGFPYDGGM